MLCESLVAPAVAVLFHMSTSHTVARECVCVCTNAIMCVCAYKYVAAPYMYLDVVHFNIYSRDYRIRKDQQKQKTKNNKKNKQPNELHSTTNEKERREAKKNNKNPEENHYTCGYHEQKWDKSAEDMLAYSYTHTYTHWGRDKERGIKKTSISINGKKCERARDRKIKIMMKKKKKELQRKCYVRAVWSIYLYFALLCFACYYCFFLFLFFFRHTPSVFFFFFVRCFASSRSCFLLPSLAFIVHTL